MVVWAYKWSRTFSVWKHGTDSVHYDYDALTAPMESVISERTQKQFFGLRMHDMRTAGHVVRSLHVESADTTKGVVPQSAAIKAALEGET
jgi:hypothetical protein